jgi:hypothetical protein
MRKVNFISAVIYLGTAAIIAGLFDLGAWLAGRGSPVDYAGGAVWTFLLSTIILMPIVIPLVKKKMKV